MIFRTPFSYNEVCNQALLRKLHDFHKCGSCETNARKSVIIEETGIRQLILLCVLFENGFLILNTARYAVFLIVTGKPCIQGGNLLRNA